MKDRTSQTLAFLVMPGFPMACLTSAIEPLRAANEIIGRRAFAWKLVGEDGGTVPSSAGVNFDPDTSLDALERVDFLFILSSPMSVFRTPRAANGKIRRMARDGVKLGAFSGGIFPLNRSGVMEGRTCSVHWVYDAAYRAEFPDAATTDTVISIDGPIYTASGSAAVFDLMLKFIEEAVGAETMTEVACWFQHPFVRGEDVLQKTPTLSRATTADTLPPKVSRAIELFAEHIEEPIQIADVAKAVAMSSRQLDRSFQRATGQSPSKYYRTMRLNQARKLVLYSNDPISEIALAVGYATAGPLIRHYRNLFGVSPQEERKATNQFRVDGNASIPTS